MRRRGRPWLNHTPASRAVSRGAVLSAGAEAGASPVGGTLGSSALVVAGGAIVSNRARTEVTGPTLTWQSTPAVLPRQVPSQPANADPGSRSEERRVGKDARSG